MSAPESEKLLARALVGRIGTVGPDGMPYVTPMNFVYDPSCQTVFLHCANSGHRLDNLAHSALACFEVDEPLDVEATGPAACDTTQIFRSAICFGRAVAVVDQDVKERALRLIMRKYVDELMPGRRYDPALQNPAAVTVIAFHIDKMTGKERKRT